MEPICHAAKDICTLDRHELIESDGFFVCSICGLCKNELILEHSNSVLKYNEDICTIIADICENGAIPPQTGLLAQQQCLKWHKNYPNMNLNILKATAVYIACKRDGIPRSLREIASYSGICPKRIGRYDAILNKTHIQLHPEMYVNRFCAKMSKSFEFIKKTISYLDKIPFKYDFNPVTLAALAIYLTHLKEQKTSDNKAVLKRIKTVTGVSPSTLLRMVKKTNLVTDYIQ